MLLRLLVGAAAGALVGFEREASGKRAGLRTLALVSSGAALFTMVGAHGFGDGDIRDPARIASQVAVGVGFIGGGTILTSRGSVRGLTTAAAIWMSAGLGVAAGAGLFVLTAAGTLLSVLVLSLPHATGSNDDDDPPSPDASTHPAAATDS